MGESDECICSHQIQWARKIALTQAPSNKAVYCLPPLLFPITIHHKVIFLSYLQGTFQFPALESSLWILLPSR